MPVHSTCVDADYWKRNNRKPNGGQSLFHTFIPESPKLCLSSAGLLTYLLHSTFPPKLVVVFRLNEAF